MFKITIVNMRFYKPKPDIILFPVDRRTPVGNPFHMRSESERNIVCDKYEEWFKYLLTKEYNPIFMQYLDRIYQTSKSNNIALGCWCAPKRCHAETIKKFLEYDTNIEKFLKGTDSYERNP